MSVMEDLGKQREKISGLLASQSNQVSEHQVRSKHQVSVRATKHNKMVLILQPQRVITEQDTL